MTLILTQISKYGIIHASDSNLTSHQGPAGESQKTFAVPFLHAGLTVAGSFSVHRVPMNDWMTQFIQSQADTGTSSLTEFARNLGKELTAQMTASEKEHGSIVHMAGYVFEGDQAHPEFWFIRNVTGVDAETGEYTGISPTFCVTEDFWTRDCPKYKLLESFQQEGYYQLYINGFASGRISYVALQSIINQVLFQIWNNPQWSFRPPKSLEEAEALIKQFMNLIGTLFMLSDYHAPLIGGDVQTYLIPQPPNTVTESPLPQQQKQNPHSECPGFNV
ncbi:MAG: hypothetical protein KDH08_18600 [Anaerolineae bacterium]|nr:hypothetical protein [Anaerolineae bacterium]